jgi:hypothetical protein
MVTKSEAKRLQHKINRKIRKIKKRMAVLSKQEADVFDEAELPEFKSGQDIDDYIRDSVEGV